MNEIKVLTGSCEGEITEKKSRFIAHAFEIHSEAEALEHIEDLRKSYWDARHNCYAYVLGSRNELQRFSDDKEPQGTAGKPILEVLLNNDLHNTLIVVTRYFGGILLGTGGLLRAYTASAAAAVDSGIKKGCISSLIKGNPVDIKCDYSLLGKVQYICAQMALPLTDTVYEENVTLKLLVPEDQTASLVKKITEATSAASAVTIGPSVAYILPHGIPVIYDI